MKVTGRDDIEDIILQALNHPERRNIIEILGTSTEGASYSSILGEIGLNTGKMNYHLRLLEGLIERDKNRLYTLTPIGKKAFMVLNSISEDLEDGYEVYLSRAKHSQGTSIIRLANIWFILVVLLSLSAYAGVWVYVNMGIRSGSISSTSMVYVYAAGLLMLFCLYFVRGWVQRNAEAVQEVFNRVMGRLNKR
jgi:predicted transcriptional regulator